MFCYGVLLMTFFRKCCFCYVVGVDDVGVAVAVVIDRDVMTVMTVHVILVLFLQR